ncbi:MAG: ComEC/Rec2 family competence protein [Drouetiella hepatica Uher 2000/2452]|jgi:competence protein ComEC|uniref:ComEC/Rec2 family competence protein n=1 Tax=Drouetiella hepatica Uher 2000/2452 TaxID=904376 RepID=A0A951Q752_9CYAN|nr:ComEC/Rec2 family competence protein [Drouetiella hepatica Uher 2000/2452]
MAATSAWICFAYIVGLLLTGIPGKFLGISPGAIAILILGAIASFVAPRLWRDSPPARLWLLAGLVGFLAALHFQMRLPQPAASDICRLIKSPNDGVCQPIATAQTPILGQIFEVEGVVNSSPQLTRSDRYRLQLEATRVSSSNQGKTLLSDRPTAGTIYVTLPKEKGEALYPGQRVIVSGSLYKPQPAAIPGGFNFQEYLRQTGIFTGLVAQEILLAKGSQPQPPLLWSIRRQIVQAQESSLGIEEGHLLSAMVMGKAAVDVPYELQDEFRQAGLAHALAASGAQVSMLIGVMLALTQRCTARIRLILGGGVLLSYIGLTGIEPSVLRAGVMGGVVLVALVAERKVKPLGSLLFAAVALLLWNPLWIWDLGFQLSFLATLGLLVTVPIVSNWLDWMPTAIAPLFAVPIAAYLWTLPLQLFTFGIVSPYSIGINVLVSPLIATISIGGMVSALAALIYAPMGSFLAGLLHFPTWLFIKIAEVGNQLPGSQHAVGTINAAQVLLLYGMVLLVWMWRRSHRHWWLALGLGISLVAVPAWATSASLLKVTVLPTSNPVWVIQDKGKVIMINGSSEKDLRFTVKPFLNQQGINQIDWAIAPSLRAATLETWQQMLEAVPIKMLYGAVHDQSADEAIAFNQNRVELSKKIEAQQGKFIQLADRQTLQLGSVTVKPLRPDASILQMQIGAENWVMLRGSPYKIRGLPRASVLWWSGQELDTQILEQVKPRVAIALKVAPADQSPTQRWLEQHQVKLYIMPESGSVQWSPQQGFSATLESGQPF